VHLDGPARDRSGRARAAGGRQPRPGLKETPSQEQARMGGVAKFATAGIAPAERLRYWNTIADEVFCGTFVNAESHRFEGEMWSWRLGELDMIRTRSVEASVGRRPIDAQEERVILHMQWRGSGEHRQGRREARLGPGDFVLGSPHEPYTFDLAPHE